MKRKKTIKKPAMSIARRDALTGLLFISFFLIGFAAIFLPAIISSIQLSFADIDTDDFGTINVGWKHYHELFFLDSRFVRDIVETLGALFINVIVIILYCIFVAGLLNKNIAGKGVFRALLFLPVIISTGVIDRLMNFDATQSTVIFESAQGDGTANGLFNTQAMMQYILSLNISTQMTNIIIGAINNINDIITRSGVQIVIFLAGLQAIPAGIYEAAEVEGCTAWESFWKITMPLISPLIAVNVVYTVIESFTSSKNVVMNKILSGIQRLDYGISSAMSWVYFLLVGIILIITLLIVNRFTFYETK